MRRLRNIYNLGIKELRSLLGDKAMLALIVFAFTLSVYSSATVTPGSLHLAPIAIADMDQSQLSNRIGCRALYLRGEYTAQFSA